ncbi:syntaxin-17-like isoform X2 [Physella acuta]|uniref:syntaxin-17-like isoform X2 n=1 Tax=Physella acuta TaxID=109671 RepID=UPI0027DCAB0F|nr:syntaxin-17-like isoform X2 [Physella acuta]
MQTIKNKGGFINMASFDPSENIKDADSKLIKYPMKRLDISVKKFVKVLDIDLDRLKKHSLSLARYLKAEDWSGLHKEQVNVVRTIQQVEANIKEIEKAREQVIDEDLIQFDVKIQDVKNKAQLAVKELMNFIGINTSNKESTSSPNYLQSSEYETRVEESFQTASRLNHEILTSQPPINECSLSYFENIPVAELNNVIVPPSSDASASWEQLQENIMELNDLIHNFSYKVELQNDVINSIEDNVEMSQQNIREATQNLAKSASYKSSLLPVVGAVVGGVVAGPVGLVAGIKLGSLAGALGGAVGFASGRYFKKHQEKANELEMNNLSDKRSLSFPELSQHTPAQLTDKEKYNSDEYAKSSVPLSKSKTEDNIDVLSNVTSSFRRFFSLTDE